MNPNLIIINPDRFSQQSFPPFMFLCKALSSKNIDYSCISAKELEGISTHNLFARNTKSKPFFYTLRFALFSLFSVFKLLREKNISHILVFRSFDSLLHLVFKFVFRKKIVFLVDYLPWDITFSYKECLMRPRKLLQVLGLVMADQIIVPTFFLAEKIKVNLPSLKDKVFIKPYSVEIYKNEEEVQDYKTDKFVVLASIKTRAETEVVLRAFSKLENSFLILQSAKDNYILALSHALDLLDKIEFIESNLDLLNFISKVNLFICEGSGGYIISALNSKVPVVVSDSTQNKELIRSDDFIYKARNVESLFNTISKIKNDKSFVSSFFEDLNLNSEPNWTQRVLEVLS